VKIRKIRVQNHIMTKIQDKELGFGTVEQRQRRLMTKEGNYNYIRYGLPFNETFHIYQFLIQISWKRFFLLVLLWYLVVNVLFTGLYYLICPSHLTGMVFNSESERFMEIFFFSSQTLTTVGYGRINPSGWSAGMISSLESLFGLLSFALVTGLLYGRFSKPSPRIKFSEQALIAPYRDMTAFMLRIANQLESNILDVKAQISLSMSENGSRKFYMLSLERESVVFFPSNWTLVHPIDADSPLYGLDEAGLRQADPEFLIFIQGFDDTFYQTIHAKMSYTMSEMVYGGKFVKIAALNEDGYPTVDLSALSHFEKVVI
jgi:inward rectifier potassium channel